MKVLYLHQYFVPPGGAGGTRSYEFARRLVGAGHGVRLVTSSAFLPPELADQRRAVLDGIDLRIVPVPYANALSYSRRIRAFLTFALLASWHALLWSPDVVFATSTPLTIAIPALLARWIRRRPMVFEVRDLWPELPIAVGALRNRLLIAAARALERVTYRSACEIVALSPGMRDGIVSEDVQAEKITIIPNSCDRELFDVPAEAGVEIRRRLQLQPGQPLITYAGTFGAINGLRYAVELAASLQELGSSAHVLLVGAGREEGDLRQLARDRGVLGTTLSFWDPLPKREMPKVLAATTVGLSLFLPIPAMRNNSANKFFDYLAAGKPVAINYGGWQADILRSQGAGLVLPESDPAAAAKVLKEFLDDSVRVRAAGEAARRLAESQFDRDILARRLEEVLVRCAGISRRRAGDRETGPAGSSVCRSPEDRGP